MPPGCRPGRECLRQRRRLPRCSPSALRVNNYTLFGKFGDKAKLCLARGSVCSCGITTSNISSHRLSGRSFWLYSPCLPSSAFRRRKNSRAKYKPRSEWDMSFLCVKRSMPCMLRWLWVCMAFKWRYFRLWFLLGGRKYLRIPANTEKVIMSSMAPNLEIQRKVRNTNSCEGFKTLCTGWWICSENWVEFDLAVLRTEQMVAQLNKKSTQPSRQFISQRSFHFD